MDDDRWGKISVLYHAALERPVDERRTFLESVCGGDEALRHEVESLLAETASGREFLDGPAVAAAAQFVSDAGSIMRAGRRFGTYQVHQRIGIGGMGEVYRARDTKLGRDVAIKILPRAFTTDPDRLARFEREARVLAALNHPHIGAIYGLEDLDGMRALVLELMVPDRRSCRLRATSYTGRSNDTGGVRHIRRAATLRRTRSFAASQQRRCRMVA
jgi:hypothetical protein